LHQAETPDVLVLMVASIGQMRSFSSSDVVAAGEQAARVVTESSIAPNRSLKELHDALIPAAVTWRIDFAKDRLARA